jgi:hypothetical protein
LTQRAATIHPYTKTELREAYVYVLQHRQPGDALLFEWEGVPDFLYYHQTLGVNAQGHFRLTGSSTPCNNAPQLAQLERWKRVWLVFGIAPGTESNHPIAQYVKAFSVIGQPASTFLSPGPAGAVLLAVSPAVKLVQPAIAAPTWQPALYGCISITLSPID